MSLQQASQPEFIIDDQPAASEQNAYLLVQYPAKAKKSKKTTVWLTNPKEAIKDLDPINVPVKTSAIQTDNAITVNSAKTHLWVTPQPTEGAALAVAAMSAGIVSYLWMTILL